ncbi:conserved hypothetical protein [Culex quinquefasciatus]|uniref:DUF4781 domain-containing protein n=1 Tax=Culex quinquefasciatus TaxID=7176 RepID=B0WZ01_CULQU|nr:conserved hypothetical protein [Culex quinquefasciatus]|eukprot:XP_001862623.1 conserved hypothetical protein [Culex quinquefasciatus]
MATVGFFYPNMATSTYFAIRGIHQLCDAHQHGRSINPANDYEAMVNWIQIISNVVYIGSVGLQCSNLLGATLPYANAQAYTNVIATTAKTLLKPIEWNTLTPGEQVSCCAALCFAYHEVFSLDNFNRLVEKVRLDALCETFANFTKSDFNKALFLQMLNSNSAHVLSLLNIASDWIKNKVEVTLTSDLMTITILGYPIPLANILKLDESDLSRMMEILRGIGEVAFEDFLAMVRAYGIIAVIRLMHQRSTELGGNFLLAYNQTLAVTNAFRQVRPDAIADIDVVNCELILRTGQRYTINSAIEKFGDDPGSRSALQGLVV